MVKKLEPSQYKRTSILIRKDVWKTLKIEAANKDCHLSALVSDILEDGIRR